MKEIRPPSENELHEYLSRMNITPLAIKYIDYCAIVLFIKDNREGVFHIFVERKRINAGKSFSSNSSDRPINVSLNSFASSNKERISFAAVILNRDELVDRAKKIEVKVNSLHGTSILEEEKGVIVYLGNEELPHFAKTDVVLFDENGDEIFHCILP